MIQLLATRFRKFIAFGLFLLFDLFFFLSAEAEREGGGRWERLGNKIYMAAATVAPRLAARSESVTAPSPKTAAAPKVITAPKPAVPSGLKHTNIGGPNQPEMTSFKPVDMNNLVNLFTGDFSYNIPLMDVGGYPVNLFYNGEIGPEQDASWVGLGWNINPGNVNRNMRGVPDDFNGSEQMTQVQTMKPNVTFGVSVGADVEGIGIKEIPGLSFAAGLTTGISLNNYLGIALDLGVKGGLEFKVGSKTASEKSPALTLGGNLSLDLNSRSGLTISPSVSLTGSAFFNNRTFGLGSTLATSYNSRTGIKSLQISDQVSVSKISDKQYSWLGQKVSGKASRSEQLYSTSISFARPSYIPSIRVPLSNDAYSGHFQLGAGLAGIYASAEVEAYKQTSSVDPNKVTQKKPMVGYFYSENAMNRADAVMDFSRMNDREVTPNTPVISASQYSYDVFSIQGEGTGGSIRAYRNDPGYMRDNATGSTDKSDALGVDIGIPGHYGANFNTIKTPSTMGEWTANNLMRGQIPFLGKHANNNLENIYFRNPGESSVLDPNEYQGIGATNLVRFQLSGDPRTVRIEKMLENFSNIGTPLGLSAVNPRLTNIGRKKRTQVIDFLTAEDASLFGLDTRIRNYDNQQLLDENNNLRYVPINRYGDGLRMPNHISQINVTETDGKRYVYGLPVYNVVQKDFTFTVRDPKVTTPIGDQVTYEPDELDPTTNQSMDKSALKDGFAQETITPPYAHSFLLSGLLSPDYVDVSGDGITDDDLGNAVKFNYTEITDATGPVYHKWRTPIGNRLANFNPGNRTNEKDDKGLVSYGERESWYLHSIESKTMIAVFTLQTREDGVGTIETGDHDTRKALRSLSKIELFSKADLKKNGYGTAPTNAKPIKTVNFCYDYTLCKGTLDNPGGGGKLTLTKIYFTYNGQTARTNKNLYVFSYGTDGNANPLYAINTSDRWGTYKPTSLNPADAMTGQPMRNADYPYTPLTMPGGDGTVSAKPALDANAGAWSLKKILLPSGGQIEVTYESDDYAYVQNKRASNMMTIAGFGATNSSYSNQLYTLSPLKITENYFLFIKVPEAVTSKADVFQKYLQGVDQIAVRMSVTMPRGQEYITSYTAFDDYGMYNSNTIWVSMHPENSHSPLALSAIEFLREQLPAQAFPGYDVSGESSLESIADALAGMLDAVTSSFIDPVEYLHRQGLAKGVQVTNSFARLNNPYGYKYGGGQRVKSIKLKDNWGVMSGTYNTVYDQEYRYETTETSNGVTRNISSGVASYEPGVGGDENPFQAAMLVADKLPLGPSSYGSIEMPLLEPLFPSPIVGYSKVTVVSLPTNLPKTDQKSRSWTGRQVTEFYTAKDFPVSYSHTALDGTTDLQAHDASTTNFFSKYAYDSRTLSQGFLISTNDMHGKMHTQAAYAANDTTLRVSYTENFYRNTGVNGFDETFDFVSAANGGAITSGNMGIDVELMTDSREFTQNSSSTEWQVQGELFPILFPIWLPFPWRVTGNSQNIYRAVTTTKTITYHSVLDSTVVMDKGSRVGSKSLVYDGETGQVIVTRTNNEFDNPIYSTTYPAWWAYSGMGPAYRNTELFWNTASISDGKILNGSMDASLLESGDELYAGGAAPKSTSCVPPSSGNGRLWVLDRNKNNPLFPATAHDFIIIDGAGMPYTNTTVTDLRLIRSGKRNMLDAAAATATSMVSPIVTNGSARKLCLKNESQVLAATAMEFNEKWQTDKGVIGTFSTVSNPATCGTGEVADCNGHLEKNINPYLKGLLGNFRAFRTLTFYGSRLQSNPLASTNLATDGALTGFSPYWGFDASNNLVPNASPSSWIESNRITRVNSRGLELETKNAANIYTSAQYGYRKTLPVAITSNSPSYQSMYEGFEDNGYNEGLDNDPVSSCSTSMLGLIGMNSKPVNTDTTDFNAHTGKYVMRVLGGQTASVSVPVVASDNLNFNLAFGSKTSKVLHDPGINSSFSPEYGDANNTWVSPPVPPTIASSGISTFVSIFVHQQPPLQDPIDPTEGKFCWNTWLNITEAGDYTFTPHIGQVSFFEGAFSQYVGFITSQIFDENDNPISGTIAGTSSVVDGIGMSLVINNDGGQPLSQSKDGSTVKYSLCPGHYHIKTSGSSWSSSATDPGTGGVGGIGAGSIDAFYDLSWSYTGPIYMNLNTVDGCTTTTPIAGDVSMLNPSFSFPAGKQMVLSAWVREAQTGSGGYTNPGVAYSNNKIVFSDGTQTKEMKPEGPVIEGWQRYEASFTPGAGATSATLQFVNSGGQPIYFDDIRIHPFNAEMKNYVYDPVNLRLVSELDNNNYATFYEYDEEGTLIRTKAETQKGIKTIKESRSAKQRNLTTVQ